MSIEKLGIRTRPYTRQPLSRAVGQGSNELGRGSNELGRDSNELGRGSNDRDCCLTLLKYLNLYLSTFKEFKTKKSKVDQTDRHTDQPTN